MKRVERPFKAAIMEGDVIFFRGMFCMDVVSYFTNKESVEHL
jgi:hypothetical protein